MLTRTHPIVEGLASHVLESALDEAIDGPGRRCGVVRTNAVSQRTTVLLLRTRFHILDRGRDGRQRPLLAEDLVLTGFTGAPDRASWLSSDHVEPLLDVEADANIGPDQAQQALRRVLERFDVLRPRLDALADERGEALLEAHRRVRKAARSGTRSIKVEPHKPADVLGVYVYLPAAAVGAAS
jgi:hypothetical protein